MSRVVLCAYTQTQRFRAKVKILLERLIRKYGYEKVEALVPQQHHPLLHAVKKNLADKKKAKVRMTRNTQHGQRHDTHDADAVSHRCVRACVRVQTTKKGKTAAMDADDEALRAPRMGKSWIMDSVDEPIDFTDPSHIQHVTCTPLPALVPCVSCRVVSCRVVSC